MPLLRILGVSFVVTVTFLVFVLLPSNGQTALKRYQALFGWDSHWYRHIAVHGYVNEKLPSRPTNLNRDKNNVAFFPGYPIAGKIVEAVTPLPIAESLLLAAQLACMGVIAYLLLLCRHWKFPLPISVVTLLLILSFPSAFSLLTAYSESLFLLLMLGIVYFQEVAKPRSWLWTAVHGILMSATRISAFPLSLYPLVRMSSFPARKAGRFDSLLNTAALSCVMTAGGFAFFLYCQLKFGDWNLYMKTEHIGWNIQPQYTAIFKASTYQLKQLWPHLLSIDDIRFFSIPFATAWFLTLLGLEATIARWRDAAGFAVRRAFYFCAVTLFFLSVSAAASKQMMSMIRYMFPIHVFLVLATMHMISRLKLRPTTMNVILGSLILLSVVMLKLETALSEAFMSGKFIG